MSGNLINFKTKFLKHLDILQNFILIISPYMISKIGNHSRNIGSVILIVLVLISILIGREKIILEKKIIIFGLLYLVFLIISFIKLDGDYNKEQLKAFKGMIFYILLGFSVSQINIDKRLYKWIPILMSLFSIFPIYRAFKEWEVYNFSMKYRILGDNWPSIFSIELSSLIIISIVILFYSKNIYFKIFSVIPIITGYLVLIPIQARMAIVLVPFFFILTAMIKNYKLGIKILIIMFISGTILFNVVPKTYFQRFDLENKDGSYSNIIRTYIYKRSLKLAVKSKFLGVGFYNYQVYSIKDKPCFPEYVDHEKYIIKKEIPVTRENLIIYAYTAFHSHSNMLEIFLTQGIFALIVYILLEIQILKKLIRNFKTKELENYREIYLIGIFLVLNLILNGLLDTNIYMEKSNQIVFLMVGLALNKKKNILEEKI